MNNLRKKQKHYVGFSMYICLSVANLLLTNVSKKKNSLPVNGRQTASVDLIASVVDFCEDSFRLENRHIRPDNSWILVQVDLHKS